MAAAVAFAAAVAAKKAHALALPPRDTPRNGRHHCFLGGTHIRTPDGEVEVESLAIGDLVETHGAGAKPIKWIGRTRFERTPDGKWPVDALPVKVCRSALAPLVPHTDLYLSPAHAVYLDGVLVPVRSLINGRSIVQCTPSDFTAIEYFHVELASHDVIFAEGAPAETLLASSDRAFDNWAGSAESLSLAGLGQLQPFAPRMPATRRAIIHSRLRSAFSPLIDRRQPVDVIWERIAERAESRLAA